MFEQKFQVPFWMRANKSAGETLGKLRVAQADGIMPESVCAKAPTFWRPKSSCVQ